jgi:hypothetical protein
MARKGQWAPEWTAWRNMKMRCYNPNDIGFGNYGGRGITVCDRWMNSFESFISDMGRKPSRGHSLDRIDNNGNYEPANCRWATRTEQGCNQRTNRLITIDGETHTLSEWARVRNISKEMLHGRLNRMSAERALTMPTVKQSPQIERPCEECGRVYSVKASHAFRRHHCSRTCHMAARKHKNQPLDSASL